MSESRFSDLLLHLQACPPDFFRPTHCSPEQWFSVVRALFNDFWSRSDTQYHKGVPPFFSPSRTQSLEWIAPLCWLLSHPHWRVVEKTEPSRLLLFDLAKRLDSAFPPKEILHNRMRAEECLRELFATFHLPVPGEQPDQSELRLNYLSSQQKQQRDQLRQAKRLRTAAIQQAQERLAAMEKGED